MSLATLHSRASYGIQAPEVRVEVHLSNGLPAFTLVGLPETSVKESKERVRSAILNSGFQFPPRRITVNLAPADLPKDGTRFDLAIALGILIASDQLPLPPEALHKTCILGELSLSGEIQGVSAILPAVLACQQQQQTLLIPQGNADEASISQYSHIHCAEHLLTLCQALGQQQPLPQPTAQPLAQHANQQNSLDHIRGLQTAKRALIIAASGGHNMLLFGPPGTGKTLLASSLADLLPALSTEQALECAAIHSVCERPLAYQTLHTPAFIAPHHTASAVALVGGGSKARPGEVSLAHHGVLFLDELPEFDRRVLETLREPLESHQIRISRAALQMEYPAKIQLIAAMNPCPCGYLGDRQRSCRCSPDQIQRYRNRISGPFLDRIDIQLEIPRQTDHNISGPSHADAQQQIAQARQQQQQRQGCLNSHLGQAQLDQHCALDSHSQTLLQQASEQRQLSHRAQHRICRVARSIADLAASPSIQLPHLAEALQLRQFERHLL